MAAAFVLAIGSAFTSNAKVFNVTGYFSSTVFGPTDQTLCSINNTGLDCTIMGGLDPVYDDPAFIGVAAHILKQP